MNIVECRTKEELVKYFKEIGKQITEEEISALKQSFKQAEEKTETLTLQQLNKVAGGANRFIEFFRSRRQTSTGHNGREMQPVTNFSNNDPIYEIAREPAKITLNLSDVHSKLGNDTFDKRFPEVRQLEDLSKSKTIDPDEILWKTVVGIFAASSLFVTIADIVGSGNKDSSKSNNALV